MTASAKPPRLAAAAAKRRREATENEAELPRTDEEQSAGQTAEQPQEGDPSEEEGEGVYDSTAGVETDAAKASGFTPLAAAGGIFGIGLIGAAAAGGGGGNPTPSPPPNRAPVALADTAAATEGAAAVSGSVASNDSDLDGNPLTYALAAPIAGLTFNPNGSFSFDPANPAYDRLAAGQTETIVATYTVSDGKGGSASSTLTITVSGANDPPLPAADAASAIEGGTIVSGSVAGNDSDPDGNPLTFALAAPVAGLTLNTNGSYTFDPAASAYDGLAAGQTRSVVAGYSVSDGAGGSASSTLTIIVTGTNDLPVAGADSYTTNEDMALVVPASGVLGNDSDAEGDSLTATLVAGPAHGTLVLNANGSFSYTPDANYNGADAFTYLSNDGSASGAPVTVNILVKPVNDAPIAVPDSYETAENTPLVISAAEEIGGIGAATMNVQSEEVESEERVMAIINGTKANDVLDGTGGVDVIHGLNGNDLIRGRLGDDLLFGDAGEDVIEGGGGNDQLDGGKGEDRLDGGDGHDRLIGGQGKDRIDGGGGVDTAVFSGNSAGYSVTIAKNGTVTVKDIDRSDGDDGTDTLTGVERIAFADKTIFLAPDVSPGAQADSYSINENQVLAVAAAGVLANDSDVDGDPLTAVLVGDVSHGDLTLNADGSFTYTPDAGYTGPDSFTYKANDGTVDGNTVTVSITVIDVNDSPVGVADAYSIDEDTGLTVIPANGVLGNDSDHEGDPLTAVLATGPAHAASFTLNPDGSFTYAPAANFNGTDSFTYTPDDGTSDGDPVSVTITVNPIGDVPVATGESHSTAEDTSLVVAAPGVLGNDMDADGDPLSSILVSDVSNGTLALNADGSFTYTPDSNYTGPDSFTYKVNDGSGDGNTVTVSLTVTPVNDPPAGVADAYSADEDVPLVIATPGVLANDADTEGSALSALLVAGPSHGSLALNADGSFTYTPAADYSGPDSFTYKPNDGSADGAPVTVNLTVNPVNDGPAAGGDSHSIAEDGTLAVAAPGVLGNDSDAEGGSLSAVLVDDVAHGTLALNADGSFTYTPDANYSGADSFTYRASDGTAQGNLATVSLTVSAVNDAPAGNNDSYATVVDTPLTVTGPGVLGNDLDVDGDALSALLVDNVQNGTLALNADGSFTYTPATGYTGPDSFTYRPNDGTLDGNLVTVNLNVTPPNQAPVANIDHYAADEDVPLTVAVADGVLDNDTDGDGDALSALLVDNVDNGSLTLNADGSFSYTPNANFNGTDSFTYKANDGSADSNTAIVTITVNPVNDAPVGAADPGYAVAEDGSLSVPAPGVLANDSDPEGNAFTAELVSGPTHAASFTLNPDGSFDYTPVADYTGSDTFQYRPKDAADGAPVTVTLTVTPVNDAPNTVADAYSVDEDQLLTVAAAGVLANDTDADAGASLNAVLVTGPSNGTLTLNADGSFSYDSSDNFNGTDSFTYKANDGTADGDVETVTITVNSVNDAPIGNDDIGTAGEDSALIVGAPGVLANDTDVDTGTTLTVTGVTGGTVGTPFALASGALLTLNANGSYTYNPNGKFEALRPGQIGSDSFSYTVSDGGLTDTATVNITIEGANEVPVGVDDVYGGITGNTPFTVAASDGVLLHGTDDSDPDQPASALSVTHVNGTAIGSGAIAVTGGSVTMSADGGFTFTPNAGFEGAASFTYTVADADGGTDTATVTLNVSGLVWYVDSAAAPGGNGTYGSPFQTLAPLSTGGAADGLDGANNTIFVYDRGADAYNGGIVLETGQTLRGDGEAFSVNGLAIGASANNSAIDYTSFGVTLAQGNTITGLNLVGEAAGAVGIQDGGGTVGTLTISNVGVSGQGQIIDVDQGGTLAVTLNSAASSGSSGANGGVIDLSGVGGAFTVTGATTINGTHGQTGIDLTGNTSLNASFSGVTTVNTGAQAAVNLGASTTSATSFTAGLDIDATSGTGLAGASGNTLSISGGTNTINTATGQVLNLNGTILGPSGVAFATLAAGGTVASTAISLNNVDGGSFSGGNVTLAGTSGATSDGLFIGGGSSASFSFASATIGATGDEGIELNGANGAVTFTTVAINGGVGHGIEINGATSSVAISGGTIGNSDDPAGDAVNVTGGTGAVTVAAALTKTTAGNVVEVNNHETGNVTFSASLSSTGTSNGILVQDSNSGTIAFTNAGQVLSTGANAAVTLTNNTGGTISFTGGALDIDTTSGAGFSASGGGTLTITGGTNSVNTATGQILNLSGMGIGAGNVAFATLAASGTVANTAVSLNNVDGNSFSGGNVSVGATSGATSDALFIGGGSATSFTFGSVATGAVGDEAIEIDNAGATNVSFTGNLTLNTGAGNAIRIANSSSGSVSFSGGSKNIDTTTGTGVTLTNNAATNISFTNGGLDINSTSGGGGFIATASSLGAGTLLVSGSNNVISTTTGTALNLTNTRIDAGDVTFKSISAGTASGSAGSGIILDNTGSAGGLHVTGTGSAGSGGTIQHKTGANNATAAVNSGQHNVTTSDGTGIFLRDTADVELNNMQINDMSNFGIYGKNVTGFKLTNSTINGTNGNTTVQSTVALNEGSVLFDDLVGNAFVTNSNISGGYQHNFRVVNYSGTHLNFTATGNTFGATAPNDGTGNFGDGLSVFSYGGGSLTTLIDSNSFLGEGGPAIHNRVFGGGTGNFTITNNIADNLVAYDSINNNYTHNLGTSVGGNISVAAESGSHANFNISNNVVKGAIQGGAISVDSFNATVNGKISNNNVGDPAFNNSGSVQGHGISFVNSQGGGQQIVEISGNHVHEYNAQGIFITLGDEQNNVTPTGHLTVTNNVVNNPGNTPGSPANRFGLFINIGTTSSNGGDDLTATVHISGNNPDPKSARLPTSRSSNGSKRR